MQHQVITILITALISALLAVVLHYLPWRLLIGHPLPRLWAYILGVASFALPLTVAFASWSAWIYLAALWACISSAGLAVLSVSLLDEMASSRLDARQALEREQQLRKVMDEPAQPGC
jgi:hypothetical protein